MEQWFEICNLRTHLLHLQFLYCHLKEDIQEQQAKVRRAHQDRLMQYSLLWQDYLALQNSNFKKLIIIKLQSCIASHKEDNQLWQILDQFKTFANAIQQQIQQNMSKIYIGKKVLFNIQQVEQQLVQIQSKINSFEHKYNLDIEQYEQEIKQIQQARIQIGQYMQQIKSLYKQLQGGYGLYLRKRLLRRSKEIDKNIKQLKLAILQ